MRLEFEIVNLEKDEAELIPEFCNLLVKCMSTDIRNSLKSEKLQTREHDLLNVGWISWNRKPESINMYRLGLYIADSIICKPMQNNSYVVEINPKIRMPYSSTRLEQVARFLDRGNESMHPMPFISPVFNKYRMRINEYWKSFVSTKLRRVSVRETIIVR